MSLTGLIKILQASIAPCILLSALGLLLLSLTNRLARPIDRIRLLTAQLSGAAEDQKEALEDQIRILFRRCGLLRSAIGLVSSSIFFATFIMLLLFTAFVLNLELIVFIKVFFVLSLMTLLGALTYFLADVRLTLKSLKIEINRFMKV